MTEVDKARKLLEEHLASITPEDILIEKKKELEKQKYAAEKNKIKNSQELGVAPYNLNGLSITITTEDTGIKTKFLSLISTMDLKKVADNGITSEYKLNYIDTVLKLGNSEEAKRLRELYAPLGKDFLKITFEEAGTITISLEGIIDEKKFNAKSDIIGDIRDEEKRFKVMFSNSDSTRECKQRILKAIINFIHGQNLQASTKIEHLSFLHKLDANKDKLTYVAGFMLGGSPLKDLLEQNFFTAKVHRYKSEIKNPQSFVNVYLKQKGKELVEVETLSEKESCTVLKNAIKKQFTPRNGVSVNMIDGKFYAYAEVNCRPNWNKPVVIGNETLIFSPLFETKMNYYSFETLIQERHPMELVSSGQKAYATPNWCFDNQGLVYRLPEDTMKLDEESLYYKKITSTTLLTKAEKAVTLNINDLNFTLADNADDIADFIDTIPAKLSEDAISDAKFTVAPNQVRAALQYYLQR